MEKEKKAQAITVNVKISETDNRTIEDAMIKTRQFKKSAFLRESALVMARKILGTEKAKG